MTSANEMPLMPGAPTSHLHDEVELLAFKFWMERGAPIGTPDVDWFLAEKELTGPTESADPVLLGIAKTIGTALGSVAALVNSNRQQN